MHIGGYFMRWSRADEKGELLETIDAYRIRLVPPIMSTTPVNHSLR